MSFHQVLKQFLAQAQTNDLTYAKYNQTYIGTKVRASFGKGNMAMIPWIAFLRDPNVVSHGIYPVYLLFKDYNFLILAYGVSETIKPLINWNADGKATIEEYFKSNLNAKPQRYGKSFIFRAYDVDNLPPNDELDKDLHDIITDYNQIWFPDTFEEKLETQENTSEQIDTNDNIPLVTEESHKPLVMEIQDNFSIKLFITHLKESGLIYSDQLIKRFTASLLTKPFVILTGLSGSGKTKLAQAFVEWICESDKQYSIVPVGADWTNRDPLLGYPNALNNEEYVKPDNGALDIIIRANKHKNEPHFLVLDEMNLSHVERYFADFLSVMESDESIPLYDKSNEAKNGIPHELKLPDNLFIIGTVNIDETTNMFSPKVLDRANTIEFRVSPDEMEQYLFDAAPLDMSILRQGGSKMSGHFLTLVQTKQLEKSEEMNDTLLRFFKELQKTGAEFGYRSANEMMRLINQLTVLDSDMKLNEKLDIAIIQKLLPKLHGSRRKIVPILETLASFCVTDKVNVLKDIFENESYNFNNTEVLFPLSLEKIARMHKGAIDNGYTSFAEA